MGGVCHRRRRRSTTSCPLILDVGQDRMTAALASQLLLLGYHQVTSWFDFYPFNGVRNYSCREKFAEVTVNAGLMSLAPIGFGFHITGLMIFGVIYYFVLLAAELIIWWIPY